MGVLTKVKIEKQIALQTAENLWGRTFKTGFVFKITRSNQIADLYCYSFTKQELEDFESDCYKSAPFPKLVRPADTTDAYCYKFASSDVGFKTELPESATSPN